MDERFILEHEFDDYPIYIIDTLDGIDEAIASVERSSKPQVDVHRATIMCAALNEKASSDE